MAQSKQRGGPRRVTRYGRISEGKAVRWFGDEVVDQFKVISGGIPGFPVPIAGAPMLIRDGLIIPRAMGGGFATLSDLISEATTGGKRQQLYYNKSEVTAAPAAGASQSFWAATGVPSAGSNAAAAPGGTIPTNTTTGGLGQSNAAGGDTLHVTTWTGLSTQIGACMLYDYSFGVNINHATTSNSVTGVPTRYQTTATAAGVFLSGRVTTVLNATAHNITVTYVDHAGNAAEAGSAQAIRVSSAVQTTPFTAPKWTYDLNSGDLGLREVDSIALSAAATGNVDWFMGKPLTILPIPVANSAYVLDGINSAFNLVQVVDNACLALLAFFKSTTAVRTDAGLIQLVSG